MRKIIFWCHLTAGVVAGGFIFLMSVTGAVMAFEPQIVKYFEKSVRIVEPPAGAERLDADALIARVSADRGGRLPGGITVRKDPNASVALMFGRGDGVYVNPYSGVVLGKGSKVHDAMHWIEDLHRRLATKEKGRVVTGAATLAFLFMIVSGLCLWWPKKWTPSELKSITVFNSRLSGRSRDWNWHNVIGIWCAPILFFTALTGLVMAYPWANDLLFRMSGSEPPPRQVKPAAPPPAAGTPPPAMVMPAVGVQTILDRAATEFADWNALNVRFGADGRAPLNVSVMQKHGFVDARSSVVVDPQTGDVTKRDRFDEQNLGRKMRFWARYLHTGELAGPAGQALSMLAAIGAAVLVYTGWSLALGRFRNWMTPGSKK